MLMVIYMMESGKMTKHMVLASTPILTEQNMRVIGLMTSNTVKEKKSGQMVLSMKVIINSERRMEKVNSYGQTDLRMKVSFWITIYMVMESTNGLMEENSLVIGYAIRCMGRVYLPGLMEEDMKVTITMIKNRELECSYGQMVGNMMVHG